MKIVSVNIGSKKTVEWKGKMVETGIFKNPVDIPVFLGEENVENDSVIDRRYHGGIDKAVYAYSEEHYGYWKNLYPNVNWQFGMFGENLTVSQLNETEINVGNVYKLGEVIVEVTKPREPCYKLGIRFGSQSIVKDFWNSNKSGIYFKVLQTGNVRVGDTFQLISKKENSPTIAEVYELKKVKNKE